MFRTIAPVVGIALALVLASCAAQPAEEAPRPAAAEESAAAETPTPTPTPEPVQCSTALFDAMGEGFDGEIVETAPERADAFVAVAEPSCAVRVDLVVDEAGTVQPAEAVVYLDADAQTTAALQEAVDAETDGMQLVSDSSGAPLDDMRMFMKMDLADGSAELLAVMADSDLGALEGADPEALAASSVLLVMFASVAP